MNKPLGSHIRKFEDYQLGIKPLLETVVTELTESHRNETTMPLRRVIDIISKIIPDFDEDSLESIVCGTSMAMFQEGINSRLIFEEAESEPTIRHCLSIIFSPVKPEDSAPNLDFCDQEWSKLAEIPSEDKIQEYIGGIKGFVPFLQQIIAREESHGHEIVHYFAYFIGDMMGKALGNEDRFINENVVSLFCGISPFLFDNGIAVNINIIANYFCFSFEFSKVKPNSKRPTIDDCLEKWLRLFIEK